jgi:hypothetical protein
MKVKWFDSVEELHNLYSVGERFAINGTHKGKNQKYCQIFGRKI